MSGTNLSHVQRQTISWTDCELDHWVQKLAKSESNYEIFIEENACVNVVCKIAPILSLLDDLVLRITYFILINTYTSQMMNSMQKYYLLKWCWSNREP